MGGEAHRAIEGRGDRLLPSARPLDGRPDRVRPALHGGPAADHASLQPGVIALCRGGGSECRHLVKAIQGQRFQIGNDPGRIDGGVGAGAIYGERLRVEP